jgi:putative DNA primase/helicase
MDSPVFEGDSLSADELEALANGTVKTRNRSARTSLAAPTGVTLIRADGIRPEPIAWLWGGWLACGKVHVLAGAPGTGKTTAAVALAATLTIGGRWPDGTPASPDDVLIWSGEDDPKDTLVPRLIAAGADLNRVHFVASYTDDRGPRAFDPATDMQALSDHVSSMDPAPVLLIVDPLVSAIAGDSHKNAEVRRALQTLVELAQVRRCAVLGVSHFSKGTQGREPTERVTGSLAFGALARVVMVAAKLPEEEGGGRILVRAKSNLGIDSGGFRYDLAPVELHDHPGIFTSAVQWGEALEGSARELLGQADTQGDPKERSATTEAMDWLREHLETGPAKAKDVQRDARDAGFSDKALRTAREKLGIKPTKSGFSGGWQWAISTPEDAPFAPKMPKAPKNPGQESEGNLGIFDGFGHLGSDSGTTAADIVEVEV